MGAAREPIDVIPIVAVFGRSQVLRQWGIEQMSQRFGTPFLVTCPQPFVASGYYTTSMGPDLQKQFIGFDGLADPGELAQWKLWTNAMEQACEPDDRSGQVVRPLNLDCGYVTEAKLVLATTKDRDHRIYLSAGIYAEVTLSYAGRKWNRHRWTYPDYCTPQALDFAESCRLRLREHLRRTRVAPPA